MKKKQLIENNSKMAQMFDLTKTSLSYYKRVQRIKGKYAKKA